METILRISGELFGASCEDLDRLSSAIRGDDMLCNLLDSCVNSAGVVKTKKVRVRSAVRCEGVRCEALVWMLERDASGMWVPKQCTRGCEGGSFCKSHGEVVNKRCVECSDYHGCDVVHEFNHEHRGRVGSPTYVFEKFHDVLVKHTENCERLKSGEVPVPVSVVQEVVLGGKKVVGEKKVRVVDNAFMNWLSAHRGEIKSCLLSENVDIGGRELTTRVSKRGGEMWGALSKVERDSWKGKKAVSVAPLVDRVELDVLSSDDTVLSSVCDDGDDVIRLVLNKDHSVWVDEETGLYYGSNDVEGAPLGQMSGGKLMAFKKTAKRA